ncbi:chitosanase [Pseudodesulfovibrio alkaliphilus]|nr:chitosanase [Pseudodesulfovibrio alkaliphilus]
MSPTAEYDTLARLLTNGQTDRQPVGEGAGPSGRREGAMQAAFETQMRMARTLFGEQGGYGQDSGGIGMDASIVNDALMFDALSTINRLMRDEAGFSPRNGAVLREPAQEGGARVDPEGPARQASATAQVGTLSARFESGGAGVEAIGYDRVGGTSYGTYQIASKPGTMDSFLTYLAERDPSWAGRLREAGEADTGSTKGAMPEVWKAIAAEDPERFGRLQHDFITEQTYTPARAMILDQTGLDFDNAPSALREVLWSTAVQHGPTGAARIFGKVIDRFVASASEEGFNERLIEGVYDTRKGQFGSSTDRVRRSVVSRLNEEKQLALGMLGHTPLSRMV